MAHVFGCPFNRRNQPLRHQLHDRAGWFGGIHRHTDLLWFSAFVTHRDKDQLPAGQLRRHVQLGREQHMGAAQRQLFDQLQ